MGVLEVMRFMKLMEYMKFWSFGLWGLGLMEDVCFVTGMRIAAIKKANRISII